MAPQCHGTLFEMHDGFRTKSRMGAMEVIIPSEGTVQRVWFDLLSAVGSPGLRPAGGGFVGVDKPTKRHPIGFEGFKGPKICLGTRSYRRRSVAHAGDATSAHMPCHHTRHADTIHDRMPTHPPDLLPFDYTYDITHDITAATSPLASPTMSTKIGPLCA